MIDQTGDKPHILLVEDDRDQAFVAAYYLERGGFIADWCDTPKEAIKTAHNREYTLILLDVMLNAEKDGFQLCRQFKADPSLRDVPIIMLTARTAERDMVNGLNLGADDYVTKPYSKNELLARIRTVLKRASFQKHNTRNRELLERTDDIVLFLDREGTLETANRRGSMMLPDMNSIVKLEQLFDPAFGGTIRSSIERVLEGKEISGANWRLKIPQAKIKMVDAKLFPLHLGDRISGIGCILRDTTRREQAFQVFEQKTQALQQEVEDTSAKLIQIQQRLAMSEKMAAMGQLAAGVAHELRNPLNVVSTSIYFIQRVLKDKNQQIDHHIKMVRQEIQRAQTIINNLLEFSRKSAQDRAETDINAIIEQTLTLVQRELTMKEIIVNKDLGEIEKCHVNPDEMKQVFLNLILNAKDAMPNGGILNIKTCLTGDGQVGISFTDTGHGIPEGLMDKIFDPFFTARRDGKGVGIGLSIVHSAIERNKGTVSVDSKENEGTTFVIKLPAMNAFEFKAFDDIENGKEKD